MLKKEDLWEYSLWGMFFQAMRGQQKGKTITLVEPLVTKTHF